MNRYTDRNYDYDRLVDEALETSRNITRELDERNVEWELDENSVVFEVGSYRGRWAHQIAERYNPHLFCFEPQPWAAETARRLLEGFNAQVFTFGLGEKDAELPMSEFHTDGCSFLRSTRERGLGKIREIKSVVEELGIDTIDLMLMNIEGYEYILIPHMFNQGIFPKILVAQFHKYEGYNLYSETVELIKEYYSNLWDYEMHLSAWELN